MKKKQKKELILTRIIKNKLTKKKKKKKNMFRQPISKYKNVAPKIVKKEVTPTIQLAFDFI